MFKVNDRVQSMRDGEPTGQFGKVVEANEHEVIVVPENYHSVISYDVKGRHIGGGYSIELFEAVLPESTESTEVSEPEQEQ